MKILNSPVEDIARIAKEIVYTISNHAYKQNIDPRKIVFALGEHHDQMAHTLFKIEVAQNIKKIYGSCNIADESPSDLYHPQTVQSFKNKFPDDLSWIDGAVILNDIMEDEYELMGSINTYSTRSFAEIERCNYRTIDLSREELNRHNPYHQFFLTGRFEPSGSIRKDYSNKPYYHYMTTDCPEVLDEPFIDPKSKEGVQIRNIVMAYNTKDSIETLDKNCPTLADVGCAHVADDEKNSSKTFVTYLTDYNLHVAPILLGIQTDDATHKLSKWQRVKESMTTRQKSYLLEDFHINFPDTTYPYMRPASALRTAKYLKALQDKTKI